MFSSSKSYFQPGKPSSRKQQDVKTFFKWFHFTGEAIFLPATSMIKIFPPELPPKSCCYGCRSGKEKRENWSLVLTSQQYVNGLPKRTCANIRLVWAQSFGCVWRSTEKDVLKKFCFKVLSISERPRTRVFHVLSLAKGVTGSKYNDLYLERSVQCVTCYF